MLREQFGRPIEQSGDCQLLALDIETKTGEHVGVNTIKRLLGFISDEREARVTTLNIIAQYLNFDSWDALKLFDSKTGNSGFDEEANELHSSQLKSGDMIEINYLPNRRLVIMKTGGNLFNVVESENGKLQVGDTIHIDHFVSGYPMLVSEVTRNGKSLGSFTAGKARGIKFKLLN